MIRQLSLRGWLLLSYWVVFSLPWVAIVGTGALDRDLRQQTREQLTDQAHLWALRLAHEVGLPRDLAAVAANMGEDLAAARDRTLCGAQIVDASGTVLAASGGDIGHSLADDAEVRQALGGEIGEATRKRNTTAWHRREAELDGPSRFADVRLFVAVPITVDDQVIGAVVMSRTPREEVQAFVHMGSRLAWGLGAVVVFTFALALGSGHLGSRSLASLAAAARRIADGRGADISLARSARSHVREVAALSDAVGAMHAKLERRLADIDEFAANVAHEFRTPITTLRGTLELLHDDPAMPDNQRDRFLANAHAELVRLQGLVDGLLALARAERSTPRARIDLGVLAHDVAARHDVEVAGEAGEVVGAARQLESVLDNLLSNARRHGGTNAHVSLRLFGDDDTCGFEVIDNGPGFAREDRERIFTRFFTTAQRRGTGLGLALVKMVVEAHGGTVSADSEARQTRFWVQLPRARD